MLLIAELPNMVVRVDSVLICNWLDIAFMQEVLK